MSHSLLANIWFVLWCVIWVAYFIFDSYTLGIGMMFPYIAKNRQDRNQLQEVVGPFWNGAEVWLITAGGATFAAFPAVYADMFSFLYVPFYLALFALIFRAVGLEFMHKDDHPMWVKSLKWTFGVASFFIPVVLGVLFANLFYGLEIGKNGMEGSLLGLFKPYAILGATVFVLTFLNAGVAWIHVKADGQLLERANKIARVTAPSLVAALAMFFVATANRTPIFDRFNEMPILYIIPTIALISSMMVVLFVYKKKYLLALASTADVIIFFFATGFTGMYPNMLPSRLNDAFSLTLHNSASSQKTLQIMFIVACIFVPIVLAYQIWTHYLFRERVTNKDAKGYH
ncbi:MAG: cydB2 [Bacillales bacterium]|nr:cydB2 [Bacillales bacterium]